jgi:hypothetical protein
MNLLAPVLQSSLPFPTSLPAVDIAGTLLKLVGLLPLVGGYLLAREGKGNLLFEVGAVLLLVLATVIPFAPTQGTTLTTILEDFLLRWPVMVFLLGLAFVRDGGGKIVLGVMLMAVSGVILLPAH